MFLQCLTVNESKVMLALCAGMNEKQILKYLGFNSRQGVCYYTRKLYKKAGVHNRAELINKVKVVGLPIKLINYFKGE